uniref:Uncharacterized protein n=1 Tax=Anguilla anguilla TaxID=7936 RepID=A0A0E9UTL9_ANGAN
MLHNEMTFRSQENWPVAGFDPGGSV